MATKPPVVLPPNRAWTQPNTGYIFGSVYSSQNVNLEIPGIISLSKRTAYVGRQNASGSTFDYVLSIVYDGQALTGTERYYIINSDTIWTLSQNLNTFAVDAISGTPNCALGSTDGIIWNDGLYVTTSTNMSKLVAGTWTGSLMTLSAGLPHPLCQSTINNYLLVGNGNVLKKRTTAGVNSDAITIPDNYRIQWIRSDNARVLIGTRNLNGGNSAVFEWDESASAATNKYDIDNQWVYAGEFRNTDFFIVVSDGRLMKFNGGGFSEVARWPIYKTLQGIWNNGFTLGSVFQRGIRMVGGRVTVLINGEVEEADVNDPLYPNQASGIWEFDESTGLNHKYGLSFSQTDEDYAQMTYAAGAGALGGIFIDPVSGAPDTTTGSVLLYGARLDSGTGGTEYYTLGSVVSDGTNRGQYTTTRVETVDIADESMKLWCKFRGVFTSNDKIIFKYKDQFLNNVPFNAGPVTWTSNTTFTTTDATFANAAVGYEVTVTDGKGGGSMAHITSIALNTGTYTVILDEAITSVAAADEGRVIVDNYKKLEVGITSTDVNGYKDIPIPQPNPRTWIQIKVEMRGSYKVTIEELQLITAPHVLPTP